MSTTSVPGSWPSPAEEELSDTLTFDQWLVPHKESSCLVRITTETMRAEGIYSNDIAIVERGRIPKNGDLVIAQVATETLIRRYQKQADQIVLTPPGPDQESIRPTEEVRLLGVVTALIRKYR